MQALPKVVIVDEPYTDPQTGYEYACFTSFLAGSDPIPHWRNAQIRRIRKTFADAWNEWRINEIIRLYDRQGTPACGCGAHHPHIAPETTLSPHGTRIAAAHTCV